MAGVSALTGCMRHGPEYLAGERTRSRMWARSVGGREDRLCAEDLPTNTGDPNPTVTRYMPQTLTRRSACENRKEYQTGAQALDKNR